MTQVTVEHRLRVQGLDLLRGVAVGLVMLRHALPDVFPGAGVVGVVMFFALSGHLITGLLTEEHTRTGRVDLRRFYARRAWRLVPPLLVVLAAVTVVTWWLDPLGDRATLPRDLLVALTWTGNLPHLTPNGATFHLWTLATEEQFYLLWPVLLVLCIGRARPGRAVGAAAAGTGAVLLATVVWSADAPEVAYALPTSWAVCFVIGAASRLYGHRLRIPRAAVPAALLALGALSVIPLRGHSLTYLVGGPVIAGLTVVLLLAWTSWTEVRPVPLTWLVRLGTVSYSAYLWNYPLTLWLRPVPWGETLAAVLTVLAAAASWRWVERPLGRLRSRVIG
ncbi:acyltransferase [uncultured Modestobacter sp.]|uniref:acyltransferase family protein n=1 Tax=uncultured Modestobacter sp. TaxID=380048 RepID=UPI0026116DE2|nr:acyltransferase [uncultured Modestobacter sp.]